MIHYTDRIWRLMDDVVRRVDALSFIDMSRVLVFGRFGRIGANGAYATCHCLNLPTSEPGYYFWRNRQTGRMTRRSEWFVTKTPRVAVRGRRIDYLVSFSLPRFCEQSLEKSRKHVYYPGMEPWIAKLDTVVHELYHIDPEESGIRRVESADGEGWRHHGPEFFERVADFVRDYLATDPDPAVYDFLRYDFARLQGEFGGVVATTFRNFPSFPQRYPEVVRGQPAIPPPLKVVPLKPASQPSRYSDRDLCTREFTQRGCRRLDSGGGGDRAA
jgi:hypothetical protein